MCNQRHRDIQHCVATGRGNPRGPPGVRKKYKECGRYNITAIGFSVLTATCRSGPEIGPIS